MRAPAEPIASNPDQLEMPPVSTPCIPCCRTFTCSFGSRSAPSELTSGYQGNVLLSCCHDSSRRSERYSSRPSCVDCTPADTSVKQDNTCCQHDHSTEPGIHADVSSKQICLGLQDLIKVMQASEDECVLNNKAVHPVSQHACSTTAIIVLFHLIPRGCHA